MKLQIIKHMPLKARDPVRPPIVDGKLLTFPQKLSIKAATHLSAGTYGADDNEGRPFGVHLPHRKNGNGSSADQTKVTEPLAKTLTDLTGERSKNVLG